MLLIKLELGSNITRASLNNVRTISFYQLVCMYDNEKFILSFYYRFVELLFTIKNLHVLPEKYFSSTLIRYFFLPSPPRLECVLFLNLN